MKEFPPVETNDNHPFLLKNPALEPEKEDFLLFLPLKGFKISRL